MQILNPQKSGVPRVPCVPELLKAFNFGPLKGGTQMAHKWNTWAMAHKRCSRFSNTSNLNSLFFTGGFLTKSGADGRVFSITETGRGGDC